MRKWQSEPSTRFVPEALVAGTGAARHGRFELYRRRGLRGRVAPDNLHVGGVRADGATLRPEVQFGAMLQSDGAADVMRPRDTILAGLEPHKIS